MATKTKKRFKEAELIDQNETQAQAVPATDSEVAQAAAPVEAAPAANEATPEEEEAVLPEGTDEATADAGVEVNPETVSVQVQIPVDQLGAAVAQATGDQEVANLSPDVQAAQEEELVADNATEGEDIPVEGATEEAPAEEGGELAPQLESKECGKEDKLTEDVFTDNSEVEGQDNYGKGDSSDEDYQAGKDTAEKHEQPRLDMIDHAIKVEGETLTEGVEDKVISEDPAKVAGDVDDLPDDLPPGMDGEIEGDIDPALLDVDGDGDIPGLDGEVAIDEDDPAVQDFLNKIDGYLADEDAHPAQVADALRASADFFDAIDPEDEADDEDLLDVEEGDEEDEGEIPLDLDAIETNGAYSKTGDEVLDQFADVPEEEDYEESLVRVPCKFPKKRFGEKKVARELPLVRENKKIKESEDSFNGYGKDEGAELIADLTESYGAESVLDCLVDWLKDNASDALYGFMHDYYAGDIATEEYFGESKKVKADKLTEEVDYSAVKFPAGSEEENMVEAYEKTQASRRKAIKNFRESVIRNNENHGISAGKSRFDEALRSSVRTSSRPSSNGKSNSWSNNRFVERMEEREELDFKALIRDGFLG